MWDMDWQGLEISLLFLECLSVISWTEDGKEEAFHPFQPVRRALEESDWASCFLFGRLLCPAFVNAFVEVESIQSVAVTMSTPRGRETRADQTEQFQL